MIAALYVQRDGAYFGIEDVDPWDEARDARRYAGPWPVVAHPPCTRWCQLAGLVQHRYGHKVGDDGGCFEAALNAVRTYGGVLEHPAYSKAWEAFGLPIPDDHGWTGSLFDPGFSAHVEQGRYGHAAKKATWLYAVAPNLPELRWGSIPDQRSLALVSWCGNRVASGEDRPRLGKKAASATPLEFREVLLSIARGCPGAAIQRSEVC